MELSMMYMAARLHPDLIQQVGTFISLPGGNRSDFFGIYKPPGPSFVCYLTKHKYEEEAEYEEPECEYGDDNEDDELLFVYPIPLEEDEFNRAVEIARCSGDEEDTAQKLYDYAVELYKELHAAPVE